ncbi:NAD-dependent protein deacetylase sirtuin-1 [Diabrotica undecimpunctata]|uniref:NAD-dependent protein deacetylase sirtuin-1 n=1 Tax=Diabrotica undecimpunctata TaxID=50387 RepID=UPI003B63B713
MDSYPDVQEHESCAKRIKLDLDESNLGELCKGEGFSCFSTSSTGPIDITEGISADCDSGYEASNLESVPTPLHTSPRTDPGDIQETMSSISESFMQTPTHTDQQDTSQDSLIEDDDDNASTVSELSGLSDLSGQDWKPMAGSMIWIQQQMQKGVNPREILGELGVDSQIPEYVDDIAIWKLIINMLSEPPRRNKLRHINTLDDVVRLLKGAQNIIVLTGAGVSVSCGIPDFRSRDGIYSRLAIDFPNLPDPQAMFDISYFSQDPRPFFKFARDIYPGKFQPSPCHRFIKLLEKQKKLLRNYTQNIDTLEKEAKIDKVIECHGSFATATCTKCSHKVTAEKIRDHVLAQKIPLCEICHPGQQCSVSTDDVRASQVNMNYRELVESGIMKPDIVFFGEGLPDTFHEAMIEDKSECDLLLVIGSSLKVRPVALIPSSLPSQVPQILINREPLPHCHFDVELLGDCDVIINHLCRLLGNHWEEGIYSSQTLHHASTLLPLENPPLQEIQDKPPIPSLDFNYPHESDSSHCICKSTNSSSLSTDVTTETQCLCFTYKSINDSELENKSGKERHMSIDSAKDSGIGENSNFTDKYESDENGEEKSATNICLEIYNDSSTSSEGFRKSTSDLRGYWQPKVKKSLADRLPENAFHLIPPSRYIFPGAEVFYDPDEKLHYEVDTSNSEDSESESECGSQNCSL